MTATTRAPRLTSLTGRVVVVLATVGSAVVLGSVSPTSADAAAAPTVAGVSPRSGPASGGTRVTVTGTGFTHVKAVEFATRAGTHLTVSSSTTLQITSPGRAAGVHNIVVVTDHGNSRISRADYFTFQGPPTISYFSPAIRPVSNDTAVVTVHGSGFYGVTRVDFGSTPSPEVDVQDSGRLYAFVPKRAGGTVNIRVVTSHGTSAVTTADRFRFYTPGPNAASWGTAKPIVSPLGSSKPALSCVGTSFCIAVSSSGRAARFDGSEWRPPVRVNDHQLVAVSCVSSRFCTALDPEAALTFDGSHWSARDAILPAGGLRSVSCVSSTFCVAISARQALVYRGSWGAATTIVPSDGSDLSGLDCPTTSFCVATTEGGDAVTFDGTSWSAPTTIDAKADLTYTRLAGVSCPTSTFCMAWDTDFNVARFDGTSWSAATRIAPGDGRLTSLSCASPVFCVADDEEYNVNVTWDGTRWSYESSGGPPEYSELDCVTSTFCVALSNDNGVAKVYDGQKWAGARQALYDLDVQGVSCAERTFCVGVGGVGVAATFNGTSWSEPTLVRTLGNVLTSVSCPSRTFCAAVGTNGYAATFDGTRWSPSAKVGPNTLNSVSCASATFCVAGGSYSSVLMFDGRRWSAPIHVDPGGGALAVSCPQTRFCAAVDTMGRVVTYNGSTWTRPSVIDRDAQPFFALSCASATLCTAAGRNGVVTYDGARWSGLTEFVKNLGKNSVSCVGAACVVGYDNQSFTFDGARWSKAMAIAPQDLSAAVACARDRSCLAFGSNLFVPGTI